MDWRILSVVEGWETSIQLLPPPPPQLIHNARCVRKISVTWDAVCPPLLPPAFLIQLSLNNYILFQFDKSPSQIMLPATSAMASPSPSCSSPMMSPCLPSSRLRSAILLGGNKRLISLKTNKKRSLTVVAAAGEVSADGTTYLIAGAAAVALLGTAFPILFSRKDLCPECDGAGFIRQSAATLRANAARKDQAQIVCPRCNGLGKLNQIDK